MEKKLFLLDAMALIYRAYFALNKNPRITSTGINTSAFLGFANTLLELLRKERPTHLGVAFDTMAPTARHLEYTEYKANREKMPEDIAVCIPYIKRLLEAMRIPVLYAEGYEADDVIGTLGKKAGKEGYTVYMVTPDKDFGQLVDRNIFIYKPARMGNGVEILGPEQVCEKFGIKDPLQVIDMLGLWGDASDNIPGIPGVGEVTARKLIARFGSVENLLENTGQIENPKLRERVRQYAQQARESKMLATIILDVPIDFVPDELALSRPDLKAVAGILDELEMRSFASRLFSYYDTNETLSQETRTLSSEKTAGAVSSPPASSSSGIKETSSSSRGETLDMFAPENLPEEKPLLCERADLAQVEIWKTPSELEEGLLRLSRQEGKMAFYLASAPEVPIRYAGLQSLTLAFRTGIGQEKVFHYGFASVASDMRQTGACKMKDEKEILFRFFENPEVQRKLSCFDLKNQLHLLMNQGFDTDLQAFDVMLAHYLIDPETGHDLMRLTMNCLAAGFFQIRKQEHTLWDRSGSEDSLQYAVQAAKAIGRLEEKFFPLLEDAGLETLLWKVEIPLAGVLCRMEREGVRIDVDRLREYGEELRKEISRVEERIYEASGTRFNIASPKQLGEVLYEKLQITDKPKHTRTKQLSTAEDVLQKLKHKHPVVEDVLQYRSLTKLLSTYVEALPQLIDPNTGRIHTTYNQAVTATGRLSSQNPNLQNIPIRTELGKEIRKCFVPAREDGYLLSADYSQIELRIIAHLSGDETMLKDFGRHKDVHTATAANVFNVDPSQVDPDMRRKAKMVNFGIIYGISAFGLAERLQIPRKEAAFLIERYFENYSHLKDYIAAVIARAKEKGYVETLLHRRRYLKDINSANAVVRAYSERNAVNAPVQGSSADMIKLAMVEVDRRLREKGMESKMILQVHDELVLDVPWKEAEEVALMVQEIMKNALPLRVPLEVEVKYASNWLDAH